MSRKIKTWKDPYDEGFSTCRRKEIEINPGVTVLVGCNGAGKSTLLHNIRDELKKEMDKMIKAMDESKKYEMYAEENPNLKEMLNEYKSLV